MTTPLFISPISKEIYSKKQHVLLGISPFNSYYSEEMISYWIYWAKNNFSDFNLFIPDTLPIYTFVALGYDETKAKQKAKKQAAYLKNKIHRASSKQGISKEDTANLLIDMSFLKKNVHYQHLRETCYERYKKDLEFQNKCNACTEWILNGYTIKDPAFEKKNIAVQYLLDEMPLFMNTASILNKPSSVFLYHQTPKIMNYLYTNHKDSRFIALNQGFIELHVKNYSQVFVNGVLTENETG